MIQVPLRHPTYQPPSPSPSPAYKQEQNPITFFHRQQCVVQSSFFYHDSAIDPTPVPASVPWQGAAMKASACFNSLVFSEPLFAPVIPLVSARAWGYFCLWLSLYVLNVGVMLLMELNIS
ncbi:hypothetical protein L1987_12099 [Smallanthus sonchifolius]|uniref:Uncharacterized protein n=1 Tax=Smallanthus sonchifolius TaxID=185202 RepID=A0ACB9JDE7_9ASTR|nr:hypothetical protein L1987_12099 [Smallanthus sonchifolius]